jgi:hypothetical protein
MSIRENLEEYRQDRREVKYILRPDNTDFY